MAQSSLTQWAVKKTAQPAHDHDICKKRKNFGLPGPRPLNAKKIGLSKWADLDQLHQHSTASLTLTSTSTIHIPLPLPTATAKPRHSPLAIHMKDNIQVSITTCTCTLANALHVPTNTNRVQQPCQSPHLKYKRIQLTETLCHTHLPQRLHITPQLHVKEYICLNRVYITTLQRTVGLYKLLPTTWHHMPERKCLELIEVVPLINTLRARRLQFRQRLLCNGNPLVCGALHLAGPGTFWAQLITDLNFIHGAIPQLHSLAVTAAPTLDSVSVWCTCIMLTSPEWPNMLKNT
eukprot:4519689-Amphidinium_carterae.1